QAEDGIRDFHVTGVQTCALPIAGLALVATKAYAAGWYRALDDQPWGGGKRRSSIRPPWWERLLAPVGRGIVVKDIKLLFRDPSRWSQLLVLAALAGGCFIRTASL